MVCSSMRPKRSGSPRRSHSGGRPAHADGRADGAEAERPAERVADDDADRARPIAPASARGSRSAEASGASGRSSAHGPLPARRVGRHGVAAVDAGVGDDEAEPVAHHQHVRRARARSRVDSRRISSTRRGSLPISAAERARARATARPSADRRSAPRRATRSSRSTTSTSPSRERRARARASAARARAPPGRRRAPTSGTPGQRRARAAQRAHVDKRITCDSLRLAFEP